MNVEDTLKYLPSLLVRKRYVGDTQAPLATRTTGLNGSARSLIYADGVLLSSLINNNNGNGSPQWFMVAPEEIARVDMLYGPYSAAFAGNSYGGVAQITTRMPQQFEATASIRGTSQRYSQYGSHDRYGGRAVHLFLGDKVGDFSWLLSAEHLESSSQPMSFGTLNQSTTTASGTSPVITGQTDAYNRVGAPIDIIGAGNITHSVQDNVKLKLAYDLTPSLSARYSIGYWQNDATAYARTVLKDSSGNPYYGGSSGSVNIGGFSYNASSIASQFASNATEQAHLLQSLLLQSRNRGIFNWQLAPVTCSIWTKPPASRPVCTPPRRRGERDVSAMPAAPAGRRWI